MLCGQSYRLAPAIIALLTILSILVGCAREPALEPGQTRLSVMSFNVRFDNPSDQFPWSDRLPAITQMISERQPDIMGLQEPLAHQVEQLADTLDGYDWVGVGTNDGERAGTFTPVFFRTDQFELGQHGTFWLSPTPDQPSLGWDAEQRRVVTWAELLTVDGGPPVTVFNTHFDHVGSQARAESARLLTNWIAEQAPTGTVIITGDFNTVTLDPALGPLLDDFDDARVSAPVSDLIGSFNHWRTSYGLVNIDLVLSRGATAGRFETVNDDYGVEFLSDHFPIVATLHVDP